MRSSNTYIYNSFPIPIRRLWISIYTSTIESTKLSCHIFIVISSQNFMLYRMFQICFSIIFPRYFFGWICFPHVMFLCFPYVIFSPLNFPRIFYMIFCSFFLHCTWWFPILYGTWFFLFFLKVVSDICLVVFSVLVICYLFLEWRLVFLFSFVNVFFHEPGKLEAMR
jgi:hypothetical protein